MIGPGRSWPCRTEGSATPISSLRRPRPPHGCLLAAIRHSEKTSGGNAGNTGNLPNEALEPLLVSDIKELERHGSASPASAGNWRKLAEIPRRHRSRTEGFLDTP
jgi:hypothetical protein